MEDGGARDPWFIAGLLNIEEKSVGKGWQRWFMVNMGVSITGGTLNWIDNKGESH